jgi:hypothetical protein
MGCADQPRFGPIKEVALLVIHFHGHVSATVQVGMHLVLKSNGKCSASLSAINHIKDHCLAAIFKRFRPTQMVLNLMGHKLTSLPLPG